MKRIAILVSGSGSNMMAVIEACKNGHIAGKVGCVISSNHTALAIEKAKQFNISTYISSKSDFSSPEMRDEHMLTILEKNKTDLIVLAGYLGILSSQIIRKYSGKIINVHPSLLPKFGGHGFFGMNVHKAVIEAGEKYSGATVHLVDEGIDTGKILSQEKVKVEKSDTPETLAKKVLKIEHKILVETIKNLTQNEQKHLTFSQMANSGCYYTPHKFVSYLIELIKKNVPDYEKATLIDTSCGYGSMFYGNDIKVKRRILSDIDEKAVEIARGKIKQEAEFFVKNALCNTSREKYNLSEDDKIIVIGNPPYNDVTSHVKNEIKTSNKNEFTIDEDLKTRDYGISFMLSYDKFKADFVAILHPFSYLIKKANFKLLEKFFKHYSIVDSVIINSQEFSQTSRLTGFPIIIALYKRGGATTYSSIMERKWYLPCGKSFNLNKKFIGELINKYPPKIFPDILKAPLFWTMRDINALRRNKTFIKEVCANAVLIDIEKLPFYCYVDVFKDYVKHIPFYLGNLDVFIDLEEFEKIKTHFMARSAEKHPHLKTWIKEDKCDKTIIDEYFKKLLGGDYID